MIEKIMDFLNCDLKDVMEWIPDEDAAEHDKIQKIGKNIILIQHFFVIKYLTVFIMSVFLFLSTNKKSL